MSKLKFHLARAGITFVALAVFMVIRADVALWIWENGRVYARDKKMRYVTPGLIEDYLAKHKLRKLQLGSGGQNRKGWLNSDIEPETGEAYIDATQPFPLPDQSMHYVASEHVIEHLTYEQGMTMLKESFRVLAPGGRMRIATPDLLKFIALFEQTKTPQAESYIRKKMEWHKWPATVDPECFMLNMQSHEWGHRFLYTKKLLKARIAEAGFTEIEERAPGKSNDPELRGIEIRPLSDHADLDLYESQVWEAVRR